MNKGDLVEDFELPDETGTMRRLSKMLEAGPVVLFCYPLALSKGCTAESCYFRDLASEFAEFSATRVGLSGDSIARQSQFSTRHSLDYPLLSDPDGTVTSMLGVKRGLELLKLRRWTFVIGTDGRLVDVIKSEISMHAHADRALEVLRRNASQVS